MSFYDDEPVDVASIRDAPRRAASEVEDDSDEHVGQHNIYRAAGPNRATHQRQRSAHRRPMSSRDLSSLVGGSASAIRSRSTHSRKKKQRPRDDSATSASNRSKSTSRAKAKSSRNIGFGSGASRPILSPAKRANPSPAPRGRAVSSRNLTASADSKSAHTSAGSRTPRRGRKKKAATAADAAPSAGSAKSRSKSNSKSKSKPNVGFGSSASRQLYEAPKDWYRRHSRQISNGSNGSNVSAATGSGRSSPHSTTHHSRASSHDSHASARSSNSHSSAGSESKRVRKRDWVHQDAHSLEPRKEKLTTEQLFLQALDGLSDGRSGYDSSVSGHTGVYDDGADDHDTDDIPPPPEDDMSDISQTENADSALTVAAAESAPPPPEQDAPTVVEREHNDAKLVTSAPHKAMQHMGIAERSSTATSVGYGSAVAAASAAIAAGNESVESKKTTVDLITIKWMNDSDRERVQAMQFSEVRMVGGWFRKHIPTPEDIEKTMTAVSNLPEFESALELLHPKIPEVWLGAKHWLPRGHQRELVEDLHVIVAGMRCGTNLRVIDLHGCPSITGAFAAQLPIIAPNLFKLGLDSTSAADASLSNLPPHHNLRELSLYRCSIRGDFLSSVAHSFPVLEQLDLSHTTIDDHSLIQLRHPTLKSLSLKSCKKLKGASLSELNRLCPNLLALVLSKSHVTDGSLVAFHHAKLEMLDLTSCKRLACDFLASAQQALPALQALYLGYTAVNDYTLGNLSHTNLRGLWLFGCSEIDDAGVTDFHVRCPGITKLSLNFTGVSPPGVLRLVKNMPHAYVSSNNL
jgi:hypothetical protein